jgi:UDP-N-acetylglucosamine 4,6-dehydratase/5-epimerase
MTAFGFLLAIVRDRWRLRRAMDGCEAVIHAAALKRIEVSVYNPVEMKKTNEDGSDDCIEAARDAGVKKCILVSTDKAYRPLERNPYGLSKAMAERFFLSANASSGPAGLAYSVVRYGNNAAPAVAPERFGMVNRLFLT